MSVESGGISRVFARISEIQDKIKMLRQAPQKDFRETLSRAEAPADVPADLAEKIRAVAERYGLPPELLTEMARQESNFNPHAVSPKGAEGILQLMPTTAREMGVENPFDVDQNLEGGARYLATLRERFGSLPLALAAYNAGPENVERYRAVPPFHETQNYVRRVLGGLPEGDGE